jgi:HAD superfamily hydrolase (TIGR01509 family)
MCQQMGAAAGIEAEAVRRALFDAADGPSLQWRFERGEFDAATAYEHLCRQIAVRPDREALYAAHVNIFAEMPETIALAGRLAAAGNRLGVLSNTNPLDWAFVRERFAFVRDHFELAVLSFEVREMKPHAAIYEHAARRAGVPAGEVFFTDDREENVAGALAAGLDAVLFTSAAELEAELRRRGVRGASA